MRVLTDKELQDRKRRRNIKAVKKVAKDVINLAQKGLDYLGQKPARRSRNGNRIDLGFGKPKKRSHPSSFESELADMSTRARKIRIARAKIKVRRERALKKRLT